ncbi:MAG: DUF445 family protein [Bacteroidota bacterium]
MHWTGYLIIILLTAFTGWFTTWIAIKMLFHPRKAAKIFGMTVQGILPKNQPQIAQKIGLVVNKEFLSFDAIEQKITNPENLEKLRPDIEAHIDHFLRNKLKDVFPMLSMFIGDKTINQLKEAFLMELESLFPVLMKNYMGKLQEDLNLEQLIRDKIADYPLENLEEVINRLSKKEFQLLGITTGLIVGIIQVLILMIIQ